MSLLSTAMPRPFSARQRTALLHRMLLIRHLTEREMVTLTSRHCPEADFHLGEEAVAVGVLSALGPADALVSADHLPLPRLDSQPVRQNRSASACAVTACFVRAVGCDAEYLLDTHRREQLPVVLFRSASVPATANTWGRAPLIVADALDVEAILRMTRLILQAARTGAGPRRLGLRTAGLPDLDDPVNVLVTRMHADHQLDDNALQAIDADAASRAKTWSTLR